MWIEDRFMDAQSQNKLMESAGNNDVLITTDIEKIHNNANEIEIVLGDFPRECLSMLPNLKWFQQFGTGVEWLFNHQELKQQPFILTNCSDGHHDVVADHLMAMLLAVVRDIPSYVKSQSKSTWQHTSLTDCNSLFQLRGKTVLVIGLGSVGLAIIKRLESFGVNIIGVRKNITKSVEHVSKLYSIEELNIAAKEANIVISSLPKTAETSNLFNEKFFNTLNSPSFFFNIGRGNAVDETALINALETEQINGAGIDVTIEEPLNKESALWTTPKLLITPHVGGTYNDVMKIWRDVALDNLDLYQKGAELRNVVDKQSGY
jgi:phosphoglycerate dehydrogenase-like enzyme